MRVNTSDLEIYNAPLDEMTDTIDGRVVSSINVGEFTVGGFPGRGDHSQSDMAFVPNVYRGIKCCGESGFRDGLSIMNTTR